MANGQKRRMDMDKILMMASIKMIKNTEKEFSNGKVVTDTLASILMMNAMVLAK